MASQDPARRDAQQLMNLLMNVAQQHLKEQGIFAPLAGWLEPAGAEKVEQADSARIHDPVREMLARLTDALRQRVASGQARAAATASSVHFGKRGSEDWRDAVELHIEHESGYCVDIFLPYRVRKGWRKSAGWRVRFSHPVGQESSQRFFTSN